MRTELSLAVKHLNKNVALKSCVIEAIEEAMID